MMSSSVAVKNPPAHPEYENMLRQLEAECRQHIRCEQQMKIHMESLTERIDVLMKDQETLKECQTMVHNLSEECAQLKQALRECKEQHRKSELISSKKNEIIQNLTKEKAKLNKKLIVLLESVAKKQQQAAVNSSSLTNKTNQNMPCLNFQSERSENSSRILVIGETKPAH